MSEPERGGPLWRCDIVPVLDWVQLELTLAKPSQPRHLRARLPAQWGSVYVHPVEGSQSSQRFIFRVQNPAGPDQLMGDLTKAFAQQNEPITEDDLRVVGLEIALDACPKEQSEQLLVDAALHMIWHLNTPPPGTLLITEPKHYRADPRKRSLQQALRDGWSLNVARNGRMGENKLGLDSHVDALRSYVKTYDSTQNQPYQTLEPVIHRARLERTLLGTASPFDTIAGWRAFRFERLAKMFAMCKADESASSFMQLLLSAGGPLGRPIDAQRRANHRRIRRAGTQSDGVLNERIRIALRKLTRVQRCGISDAYRRV